MIDIFFVFSTTTIRWGDIYGLRHLRRGFQLCATLFIIIHAKSEPTLIERHVTRPYLSSNESGSSSIIRLLSCFFISITEKTTNQFVDSTHITKKTSQAIVILYALCIKKIRIIVIVSMSEALKLHKGKS